MSKPVEGTRYQTPDDVQNLPSHPRPAFRAGEAVPGVSSWLLERKLGGGGFGEVWLVKHAWDNEQKLRAVKFCTDPAARHRLVTHEKNVVLRVMKYAPKHPNVVPLLECNLDGAVPWLMYEFVEGGTLAGAIREWRELPLPERVGTAVRVLHALADALATFHRFDPPLVHRDMKPQNVLMAGAVPRITDFGIGSVVLQPRADGPTGALTAYAARLPSALHNAGTPAYAPPEQLDGDPPDPRDDVYALGVIAYQMVTADLTARPGSDAALQLRDLNVPSELAALVVRSTSSAPDRRPKDATEWASALVPLIEKAGERPDTEGRFPTGSEPVLLPEPPDDTEPIFGSARREPRAERVPRRRQLLAAAACGVLLFGLVLAVVLSRAPSGKPSHPTDPSAATNSPGAPPSGEAPGRALKPGETRAIEITDKVKMTFCWVPAGECQLGSPGTEQDYVTSITKAFYEGKRPG